MTYNLRSVTVTENSIHLIASDKDNNEKHYIFSHSFVEKKCLEDEFLLKMSLQKKINK